jgi:hypothetical protein
MIHCDHGCIDSVASRLGNCHRGDRTGGRDGLHTSRPLERPTLVPRAGARAPSFPPATRRAGSRPTSRSRLTYCGANRAPTRFVACDFGHGTPADSPCRLSLSVRELKQRTLQWIDRKNQCSSQLHEFFRIALVFVYCHQRVLKGVFCRLNFCCPIVLKVFTKLNEPLLSPEGFSSLSYFE